MIPDASNSNLMVMRSYQIQATRAILQRMKEMEHNDYIQKEGGYIWHTTGSGKTVTSFKVAQLLAAAPKVKNVLFIVDRVDLVDQMKHIEVLMENRFNLLKVPFKKRLGLGLRELLIFIVTRLMTFKPLETFQPMIFLGRDSILIPSRMRLEMETC